MKTNKHKYLPLLAILLLAALPDAAFASNSINELSTPMEMVVGTITGPVGRWICIGGMGISGIAFIMKREELEGGFKTLLKTVFGMSFVALAASIVDSIFSFSGAVI
ncbi:TrbC/VirB2 family protein [Desulfovibrio sp. JC010]|uniref:TrbC/VirB2 family protein n=1 Tax=Desulfovibrio sp. JC010 TaxID=2593641 RepID=UPI0013D76A9B|nr:TrbC/VirB2 family protein [Desulfovibrio sp. JC010]NDV28953.1 conjugal transfer protein TrbC [Desulfovibrio sp. JC010]